MTCEGEKQPGDPEAVWVPCECGEFYCTFHGKHAFECDCPPVEFWKTDPYSEPGPPPELEPEGPHL